MLSDNQCSNCKNTYGDDRPTIFYADVRRDGHYRPTCKGVVYAKMFYGEMVLFFGGMASLAFPLNSSTAANHRHKK